MDPFSERGDEGRCEERGEELVVYDPAFMLPLASHLLDPGVFRVVYLGLSVVY